METITRILFMILLMLYYFMPYILLLIAAVLVAGAVVLVVKALVGNAVASTANREAVRAAGGDEMLHPSAADVPEAPQPPANLPYVFSKKEVMTGLLVLLIGTASLYDLSIRPFLAFITPSLATFFSLLAVVLPVLLIALRLRFQKRISHK